LYVDPNTDTAKAAKAATNAADRALLQKLADQPTSLWLGDWNDNPAETVKKAVAKGFRSLVVYNIMRRDCGSFSAGGAKTADDYRRWISGVAQGLAGTRAIVILEPDALSLIHCLSPAALAERHKVMAEAVVTLTKAGGQVYIDAGDSNWIPADEMAKRLKAVGVEKAAGVALNVSHTEWLANEVLYLQQLRARLGNKVRAVIDTSRNGRGPLGTEWCNPAGRGVGARPTLTSGIEGVDALLWVKPPGDSDGECRGGPPAGRFWPAYALELARNASPAL
jgi:endoglucanase